MKVQRLLVIGTLLVSILTGCTNSKIEEITDKPETISFMTNIGLKPDEGFDEWIKSYSEKTGIKLEFSYTDTKDYYSNLEVRFATNNVPDVFAVGGDRISIYATDNKLLDITDLVEGSEYANKIDKSILESAKVDGRIYGVPLERGGATITYIRQDWLEKVGMSAPKDYDEFIEVLRAFKKLNAEVIPFTAPGFVSDQAENYLGQFYQDATPEFTMNQQGKWVDGMLEPNMLSALQRMKSAYAEGLIDAEIVTNKTSTCRDKWYLGKVGVINYWAGNWAVSLEERLKENVDEAQVTPIPSIKESTYIERLPNILAISTTCSNPEMVFKKFIEYAMDQKEGSMLFQHGVEDIHYKIDENGKVQPLTKPHKTEKYEKAFISPILTTTPISIPGYEFEIDERIKKSLSVFYNQHKQATDIPKSNTLSEMIGELTKIREQTVAKIVTGQVDIEAGLKEYSDQANRLGIKQILYELNQSNK